jgi:hypothetical protein
MNNYSLIIELPMHNSHILKVYLPRQKQMGGADFRIFNQHNFIAFAS